MVITPLPTPPTRDDPSNFAARGDAMMIALPQFVTEVNTLAANLTAISAGNAFAMSYTFSSTTTDADPGAGQMRLDNATQASSTVIRFDLLGADGSTNTSIIDAMTSSTTATKGQIRLFKLTDPTKWLIFNVTAVASPTGYKNVTVSNVATSGVNPFVNGDQLASVFTRTGDLGSTGTLLRRVVTDSSSNTKPTPNSTNTDLFQMTALSVSPTFAAPSGTPVDGQSLMIRLKDNGTARALAFNAIYRAGIDLILPTTTVVNKWLYMGFVYNSTDTKWDLIAVLTNI